MRYTRRRFITTTAATAAIIPLVPLSGLAATPGFPSVLVRVRRRRDPELSELAARGVEAARAAGAEYADVRLTRIRTQMFRMSNPAGEGEDFGVGVRALVNGYWGFYSSAVWTPDEIVRLAQGAVDQAKANGVGRKRVVELAPMPQVSSGEWTMPIKYDPFDISIAEKMDVMVSANDFVSSYMVGAGGGFSMDFARIEKVFASTEGSSWRQTLYQSSAGFSVSYRSQYSLNVDQGGAGSEFMSLAGKGWEHISESGLIGEIPRLVDEAERSRYRVPVEIGRYEAVFAPSAAAVLLNSTLGAATGLDRAIGFDAGGDGVSFLTPPLEMLGENVVGSPQLTVTANRSQPGGVATVKWDDEGVAPEEFTIIKDGVVNDYQTTREQATWLKPWYDKQGMTVRSHGCAGSQSAQYLTAQRLPNLAITPDPKGGTLESMVASVERGVLVTSLRAPTIDQQLLNGMGYGSFREIVKGKLGRYINGAGLSFRTPNLWKNLTEVGGPSTQEWQGLTRRGGQPGQETANSVVTGPIRFKEVDIVDIMRKI